MPDKHYVTAKAAIWKGKRLLLQLEKKKNGKVVWDLPGGRLEENEDAHAGLKREVKEEIGVSLADVSTLPVKVWTANSSGDSVIALLYQASLESEEFVYEPNDPNVEIQKAEYLSYQEFMNLKDNDFIHSPFIQEYFEEYLK